MAVLEVCLHGKESVILKLSNSSNHVSREALCHPKHFYVTLYLLASYCNYDNNIIREVPLWHSGLRISVAAAAVEVTSAARIWSLAWELPDAVGTAQKRQQKQKGNIISLRRWRPRPLRASLTLQTSAT